MTHKPINKTNHLVIAALAWLIIMQCLIAVKADDFETIAIMQDEDSILETAAVVSAREIYYGDVLYFATLEYNHSSQDVQIKNVSQPNDLTKAYLTTDVTLHFGELHKKHAFELYERFGSDQSEPFDLIPRPLSYPDSSALVGFLFRVVKAEKRGFFLVAPIDFPALDEWNDPFWVAVRDGLSRNECVVVKVEIQYHRLKSLTEPAYQNETVSFDLTVKRRSADEMILLDKWYSNLKAKADEAELRSANSKYLYLPYLYTRNGRPEKYNYFSPAHMADNRLDSSAIVFPFYKEGATLPRLIRPGNRKPPVTDLPRNDREWEEIENVFSPGSLKDEIHLSRTLAAIFSSDEEDLDRQLQEYFSWLSSLPSLERFAFLSLLKSETLRIFSPKKYSTKYDAREVKIYEKLKAIWLHYHYSEDLDQRLDYSDWNAYFGKEF